VPHPEPKAIDIDIGIAGPEPVTPTSFRAALGHFCTGVTVVTAALDGEPVGFACQSFAAVSLEPPLVLFCPSRASRSWPVIERARRFGVNVLSHQQVKVSAAFGASRPDKFETAGWAPSPAGVPILDDALAWVEATVHAVHEAGDHYVVIGRVVALGGGGDLPPLLFHRGRYTAPVAEAHPTPHPDHWLTWSRTDDWI
jgi:3-hydroxy-9,10-secoandrosta-1,3,5(10)-triene-9,17-dione monooxygenase reductase component